MKKRIVVVVVLAALMAASAFAQEFFQLVTAGTPRDVQAAINNGADVNARDAAGMNTPLMDAAENNPNPEVIILLLKAGADAKAKDKHGKTAFDYANDNQKLKGTAALKQLEEASK